MAGGQQTERNVVIGAGPAGLTAAKELADHNLRPIVYEMSDRVGGISRTEQYRGYFFDIGGHRFYTKVPEIHKLWEDMLGDEFISVPRLSRIYYNGMFFPYPLDLMTTLTNLGLLESTLILASYFKAQLLPRYPEVTFEDWVTNRFGTRLFDTFFRTYTEKVWGIPVNQIQANWAAQRIKDLSLRTAVTNALFKSSSNSVKSLINEFRYPARGPGMMWEAFRSHVEVSGGIVNLNTYVERLYLDQNRIATVQVQFNDRSETIRVENVISSMPLAQLVRCITPSPPQPVLDAADDLKYRDFLIVCLILEQAMVFPDNWLYIHSPQVRVGRIQNFKSWSAAMVPNSDHTSLGMEYFCNQGDALWTRSDDDLIALASEELVALGLAEKDTILDGYVLRQLKAYPVYDQTYTDNLATIRDYLAAIVNLQTVGRNGLHRYNNQDHSMLTGLLAARNLLGESHDIWAVNTDRSYYETFVVDEGEDNETPRRVSRGIESGRARHDGRNLETGA